MSHRILKTDVPVSRGIFSDAADTLESYYYWMKNGIAWAKQKSPAKDGWSISEYRTNNVVVFHATDDEENDADRKV